MRPDALRTKRGRGRNAGKTANLILGDVYGREGYVCDTHCIRITGLLGLTDGAPARASRVGKRS